MFHQIIRLSPKESKDFLLKLLLSVAVSFAICPLIWEVNKDIDVMFGSLVICLVPAVFGWKVGFANAVIYVIAGAVGLPVFAGHQGGIHYFIPDLTHGYSQSTGYLSGYLMASLVVGFVAEKMSRKIIYTLWLYLLGHLIIISAGMWHIYQIPGMDLKFLPFLKGLMPSLLIKACLFMMIIQMIERRIESNKRVKEQINKA